jgi:trehalose 6-phosphate synthase/phosphatase
MEKKIVWVHDYHLMLVPQIIRDRLPNALVGFFVHTPFPSSEIFRCLPRKL